MKINKTFLIFALLVVYSISNIAFSQSVIKIHLPQSEGKIATIWTYKDLVSLSREVIKKTSFDKNDEINFNVNNSDIKKYFIEVRYLRISFLVDINTNYNIEVAKVDFNNRDLYPKNVVGYLSPEINISTDNKSGDELNKDLDSLKIIFNNFTQQNYLSLLRGSNSRMLVDSLEIDANKFTSIHPHKYLKDYVSIQLAQFRKMSRQYGDDYIVKTYFAKDKIAYNNPAFMSYFNTFWSKYIDKRMRYNVRKRLDSVINIQRSYQALSTLVGEDPLLLDSNLRELVILQNIPQLYKKEVFSRQALIDILYDISSSKHNSIHKQIAINMRRRLESNNDIDFHFIDSRGDSITLDNQKGKFVYIQLFDDECIKCLAEMNYTKELYEEFDDIITFIHISVDRNEKDMLEVIKDKDYPWHFVFLEDNYDFIQKYQVGVVPQAILIDKDGSIIDYNAIQPSNYFKDWFLKMLNDRKGNLKTQYNEREGIRVR